jgi:hypothetical protein
MTEQGRENRLFNGFARMDEQGKAFLEDFTRKLADIPYFAQKPKKENTTNVRKAQVNGQKSSGVLYENDNTGVSHEISPY